MNDALFLVFLILLIVAMFVARATLKYYKKRKLEKIYSQVISNNWIELLERHVALYKVLPNSLKQKLHGHVIYFLQTKTVIGCNGMEIDDVVRLTIAGNASLLVLNAKQPIYENFETILVYPDTYVAKRVSYQNDVQTENDSTMAGESWHRGPIVLSWEAVSRGSKIANDGHNVVMHEFAHKLDEESGAVNGLPSLRSHEHYDSWVEVLNQEYDEFLQRVESNKNRIIDDYGSVSPPEFFAVATESFFEKSRSMKRKLPELYKQLQTYYQLDPAAW